MTTYNLKLALIAFTFIAGVAHAKEATAQDGPDPDGFSVTGSLDKQLIRNVIRDHINEIKRCYQVELDKKENLEGPGAGELHHWQGWQGDPVHAGADDPWQPKRREVHRECRAQLAVPNAQKRHRGGDLPVHPEAYVASCPLSDPGKSPESLWESHFSMKTKRYRRLRGPRRSRGSAKARLFSRAPMFETGDAP